MYSSMVQGRLLSSLARPCRFVAHRRYPPTLASSARRFHLTPNRLSSAPSDPSDSRNSRPESVAHDIPALNSEHTPSEDAPSTSPVAPTEQVVKKDPGPYGSGVRRALRNRRQGKDVIAPVATVPQWFRERNTVLHGVEGQAVAQSRQQVEICRLATEENKAKAPVQSQGGDGGNPLPSEAPSNTDHRYILSEALWEELCASAKAGLRLPPAKYAQEPSAQKSHLVLQYPGADGILFLDAVVKRLAQELSADVVTLNAQDIAQLCSEQDMADSGATSPIRSLGYEVYRPSIAESWHDLGDNLNESEAEDTDFIDTPVPPRNFRPGLKGAKFITISSASNNGDIPLPSILGLKSLMTSFNGPLDGTAAVQSPSDRVEDRRLRLVQELISSPSKRSKPVSETESPSEGQSAAVRDVIVQVQDYGEIQATREGSKFITLLQKAIMDRRKAGTRVLFIGTSAEEVSPDSDSARLMQNAFDDHFSQMLVITPGMESKEVEKTFAEDRKRRTLDINIRHMQDMLRTRLDESSSTVKDAIFENRSWPLPPSLVKESGMDERYWPYSQIHWATTLALGSVEANEPFGFEHIQRGIEMMHKTDQTKNDWLRERTPKSTHEAGTDRERLLNSLRKTCNSHEKKLLNGVVDANNIRTTFADVHVPPETIDALKTLTSLSLIRPEAFTYGVLATDKIPGLLLYGPPGTGKTLLAKAVARESGATVLEVSGSEVYDMYVGEGEKNVKAIFTLAKKLSPCVVFIDEADAIFCSRTGASSRTSHRELINQFLREWDGMNDMSAFIMVATNRPFDLDDAVLRRLPRRLLVDLPTEQDRLAILKIHLKEETLDQSVDLAELAHRTPLYSGSDLKNLCVAAALACVREENDLAAKHQGPEPYQYPARRVLTRAHFERGMEEISASISEDMSSLSAIRKFDEQYGDRKGRRKKSAGWGFTPLGAEQAETDAARVRT
ncbi:hypothetical protein CNMCM5623_005331 [Aspergillus felis]|uniref:AAA+ ATPase domain-containing protein n=1 Tax=Aspergillus felis TaxID=1287682 RepID=A0A8H6R2Z4_9EURO|nr:hypothetical protein CNMCM5623_005331 [Aspergillus felis]KAF7184245.1 hypothetical protein CNMCM7691_004931 [Aspergillus felis]